MLMITTEEDFRKRENVEQFLKKILKCFIKFNPIEWDIKISLKTPTGSQLNFSKKGKIK